MSKLKFAPVYNVGIDGDLLAGTHVKLLYSVYSTCPVVSGFSSDAERNLFMDEINVMKRVSEGNNPHVLKMISCVTTTLPAMLVMQFVSQGNLKNYLKVMKPVAKVRESETTHYYCLIALLQ